MLVSTLMNEPSQALLRNNIPSENKVEYNKMIMLVDKDHGFLERKDKRIQKIIIEALFNVV